jgi:hypothetical protein
VEEENPQDRDPSPDHQKLDFNSQLEELPDSSNKEDSLKELELVPQSISPPFLNISLLRFSNLPETLPRTTKKPELFPDTSNSLSETTRNSIN